MEWLLDEAEYLTTTARLVELFRLLDWMMTLPDNLDREFRAELRQYQEERQMPYITSIERLAKEEGIQKGRLETLQEDVLAILTLRFGSVSPPVTETINGLENSELLRQLLLRAVNTGSVEEFQRLLNQDLNRLRNP